MAMLFQILWVSLQTYPFFFRNEMEQQRQRLWDTCKSVLNFHCHVQWLLVLWAH